MTPLNDSDLTPAATDSAEASLEARRAKRETFERIAAGGFAGASVCCRPADPADAVAATYAESDLRAMPPSARNLSLACGNPVGLAMLQPGQMVLDLGSGGGLDCFLAADQVGDEGFVIGVDMTPGMVDRARAAQRERGARNVDFRLGEIEHLPVADATIDVVLSNCVVNLAADTVQVFREAFRVLKPGGVLVVSDVMVGAPPPKALRAALDSLSAGVCVERDYLAAIEAAGFVSIEVLSRVSASPPQSETDGFSRDTPRAARVAVRVGETGETRVVEVDPESLAGFGGSFSATVRARRPL